MPVDPQAVVVGARFIGPTCACSPCTVTVTARRTEDGVELVESVQDGCEELGALTEKLADFAEWAWRAEVRDAMG